MKRKPKDRVETNTRAEPLAGLAPALTNLPGMGSEAGEPDPPSAFAKVRDATFGRVKEQSTEPLWKLGRVLLRRETAHRGGKTVVVVYDFASHLPISVIEKTAKKLRTACGAGGTIKARTIEIQGDQVAKVRETLETEGFVVGGVRS